MRGQRSAGADVPVVLAGVGVNYQPPHRRVAKSFWHPSRLPTAAPHSGQELGETNGRDLAEI
jgi:hypothetical protein